MSEGFKLATPWIVGWQVSPAVPFRGNLPEDIEMDLMI
jgi:hypothetical protein